jgi:PAS domain S-box-containing protein
MTTPSPMNPPGEELRRSEERFRLLVESVRDYAIFVLEPDGTVATWNPGASRFKGYAAKEIVGKHFSLFYTPEDLAVDKPAVELREAELVGRVEDEGWRVRKDGTRFWANVVITALRDEGGTLIGFAKVTRDLTERREAEERLRQALVDLTRSNRDLDEYASFVAHDLQEPLRKMASFAELLEYEYGGQLDDKAHGYILAVVDAARRMRALITEVMDYSRLESTAAPFEPLDLGEVVAEVLRDLDDRVRDADADVVVDPLPRISGDAGALARVFQNLLWNAIKYRDPARKLTVWVSARRQGSEWILSVVDNGIGFDPAFAARILRPFQRLHPTERYPGSGLGLASSAKIVEKHRGRLWAAATPGQGATFYVSLPAENE